MTLGLGNLNCECCGCEGRFGTLPTTVNKQHVGNVGPDPALDAWIPASCGDSFVLDFFTNGSMPDGSLDPNGGGGSSNYPPLDSFDRFFIARDALDLEGEIECWFAWVYESTEDTYEHYTGGVLVGSGAAANLLEVVYVFFDKGTQTVWICSQSNHHLTGGHVEIVFAFYDTGQPSVNLVGGSPWNVDLPSYAEKVCVSPGFCDHNSDGATGCFTQDGGTDEIEFVA